MKQPKVLSYKNEDSLKMLGLLVDPLFKLEIVFISALINKVKETNITLPNQSLEIDKYYILMAKVTREIAELLLKSSIFPKI